MNHKSITLFTLILCSSFISLIIYDNLSYIKIGNDEPVNKEYPEMREKEELRMILDPSTGKIPDGIKEKEMLLADKIPSKVEISVGDNINNYDFLGPNNIGGRTRAIAYDESNTDIILAGGISSGIFRSINGGLDWTNVTSNNEMHNVSCIVQDARPNYRNVWYYGTGEFSNSGASANFSGSTYPGNGIYKSTNGGVNWTKLQSTNASVNPAFQYVTRLATVPNTGIIYAACNRLIFATFDEGVSWIPQIGEYQPNVKPNEGVTDISISELGKICATFHGYVGRNTAQGFPPGEKMDGVWIKEINTWTKIAGKFNSVINPAEDSLVPPDWDKEAKRTIPVFSKSNPNVLYVLYKNKEIDTKTGDAIDTSLSNRSSPVLIPSCDLFKYSFATDTWSANRRDNLPKNDTLPAREGNNPFSVQSGYCMAFAVHPGDSEKVYLGGTSAFYSPSGFRVLNDFRRIGGFQNFTSTTEYLNHHPDIHAFAINPIDPDEILCGSDGGVHKSLNINAGVPVWTSLNKGYVTTQYYYAAVEPKIGSKIAIGGLQDNGTLEYNGMANPPDHTSLFGGDGCAVAISKPDNNGKTFYYYSSQNGDLYRKELPNGARVPIKPNNAGGSRFVTYFLLDPDNSDFLYYAAKNRLWRTKTATTVTPNTWEELAGVGTTLGIADITAMAVTRTDNNGGRKLFIGALDGKVYRLNDPRNVAGNNSVPDLILNPNGPPIAVSGVAVDPVDDRKVLVVYSNYGIDNAIQYTGGADTTAPSWQVISGNLYDNTISTGPSIRSCMIVNRGGTKEFYVGTTIGLYSTILNPNLVRWVREGGSGIRKSLVRSIDYRTSDNALLIGTHGNGLFYTTVENNNVNNKVYVSSNQGFNNNFSTLKEAFDAINANQFGNNIASIKIFINASTTENNPAVLTEKFLDCTITPTDNVTVTGNFNDAVVVFNGAKFVTIDGRIGNTGVVPSLTIKNTNTGTSQGCIRMSNGARSNTIKYVNCNGVGSSTTSGGRIIYIAQTLNPVVDGGNSNNVIDNCFINGGRRGIQVFGTDNALAPPGAVNDGTIIKNNRIRNISSLPIFVGSETTNTTVTGNEILMDSVINTDPNYRAIQVQGVGIIDVKQNKIHSLSGTATSNFSGIFLLPITLTAPGQNTTTVNVVNNFISFTENNSLSQLIDGIVTTSTAGVPAYTSNIYHNSVRIGGSASNAANNFATGISLSNTVNGSEYNQFNNIMLNHRSGGSAISGFRCSDITTANGVAINLDHNIYKATDTANGADALWNDIEYSNQAGLLKYKKIDANKEQNTAFKEIEFVSFTDLHLPDYFQAGDIAAKPIAGINTDIDGEIRSQKLPYRGADELSKKLKKFIVSAQIEGCPGSQKSVTLSIFSSSGSCNFLASTTQILNNSGTGHFAFALNDSSTGYLSSGTINTIATYSSVAVSLANDSLDYDFTNSSSQAYGNNMVLVGGKWSFYSGDINRDGSIDVSDLLLVYNDASAFVTGDSATNVNCDFAVDLTDLVIVFNNSRNFVTQIAPPNCVLMANDFENYLIEKNASGRKSIFRNKDVKSIDR